MSFNRIILSNIDTTEQSSLFNYIEPFFKLGSGTSFRKLDEINTMVLHWVTGDLDTIIRTFKRRGFGYHFLIDSTGKVYQGAELSKTTFHCGHSYGPSGRWVNDYSIGVAFITSTTPINFETESNYVSALENLTLDLKTGNERLNGLTWVTGHHYISPGRKIDPYSFKFEKFITNVNSNINDGTKLKLWKTGDGIDGNIGDQDGLEKKGVELIWDDYRYDLPYLQSTLSDFITNPDEVNTIPDLDDIDDNNLGNSKKSTVVSNNLVAKHRSDKTDERIKNSIGILQPISGDGTANKYYTKALVYSNLNEMRALLDVIGVSEGTVGQSWSDYNGFDVLFAHKKIEDFTENYDKTHQNLKWGSKFGNGDISTAAGRYQIIGKSWFGSRTKELFGKPASEVPFSIQNQTIWVVDAIIRKRKINDTLLYPKTKEQFFNLIGGELSKEWASFPSNVGDRNGRSYYGGQGEKDDVKGKKKLNELYEVYKIALGKYNGNPENIS